MSDTLKIATYNANGIRARIESMLDWMARESPDILCVQETKVQDEDFPADPFREAGYHVTFKGQKAHAGVAVFSREAPDSVMFGFDDGGEPDAPRLIHMDIAGITVVNTYVPQGREVPSAHFQYKLEWFARLRAFFERHHTPDDPLVWVGDFNVAPEPIDLYAPERKEDHVDYHPDARAALEKVRAWGFVDVFRQHYPDEPGHYTYWDYRVRDAQARGMGWRIDHVYATPPMAQRCQRIWIDTEARQGAKPSDHTYLIAEFSR